MDEQTEHTKTGRLVIVSNRLPIVVSKEEGELKVSSGSGGLVTALAPVLKNRGGLWLGNPGPSEPEEYDQIREIVEKENKTTGYFLHPIFLTAEEMRFYYEGFSNEILWPLFHDLPSECNFNPIYWGVYQSVNSKFAEEISRYITSSDFIWIHDYHLMLVGQELRKRWVGEKIGFFLHIPFPSLDIFSKLPWRFQILRALLEFDLVGFQTLHDQRNFLRCVKRLLPDVTIAAQQHMRHCKTETRDVCVGAFPISIDYKGFSETASGKEVKSQAWLHHEHLKGQKIVFSCDRLDISKGIPYRLDAISHLLKIHPEIHEKVTFFQVVIPSRTEIQKYQNLKKEVDRRVGEINSQFTKTGWVPIQYLYHSLSRNELIAFYRMSEILLITPVKDGMNLVAKEFIASNVNEDGVLILSEFAGAAVQLQDEAILINPYDVEGVSEAIYKALEMSSAEKKKRMRKMRRSVERYDVFWWVHAFLQTAVSKELYDYPVIEEYTPSPATP